MKTFLFNVGSEKSGTTWLHHYFKTHPEFKDCGKEINIIQRDDLIPRHIKDVPGVNDLSHYFDFFNSFDEPTGDFTHYEGSTENIFRLFKDGLDKEIVPVYIMRNPVERAWSTWNALGAGDVSKSDAINFVMISFLSCKYIETITALDNVFLNPMYFFYETFFTQKNLDTICQRMGISNHLADFAPINKQCADKNITSEFIDVYGLSEKNIKAIEFVKERFENVPWKFINNQGFCYY